jgi:thiol:disulfide interchange protein
MKVLKTFVENTLVCLIVPLTLWGLYGLLYGLFALVDWTKANEYSLTVVLLTAVSSLAVVASIVATIWELWNDRPSVRAAKAAMAQATIFPLGRLTQEDHSDFETEISQEDELRAGLEAKKIANQVIVDGFPRDICLGGLELIAVESEFYALVDRNVRQLLDEHDAAAATVGEQER